MSLLTVNYTREQQNHLHYDFNEEKIRNQILNDYFLLNNQHHGTYSNDCVSSTKEIDNFIYFCIFHGYSEWTEKDFVEKTVDLFRDDSLSQFTFSQPNESAKTQSSFCTNLLRIVRVFSFCLVLENVFSSLWWTIWQRENIQLQYMLDMPY